MGFIERGNDPISQHISQDDGQFHSQEEAGKEHTTVQLPPQQLKRGLKGRHMSMISIAGAIGTGLIIGTGLGLARGGPGSLLIAFVIVGALLYNVMMALGEMATYLPTTRGFSGYASFYVDHALGFATGANYFLKYVVLLANNLTASGIIMQYWLPDLNVGVWITVFGLPIILINVMPVRVFGEVEFISACVKVCVIIGVMITSLSISLGANESHDVIGFRYWRDPGAFKAYLVQGSTGKFLGFFAAIVNAAFAFMGSEMVGVTFGEAEKPWKTIPNSIKQTLYRISFFYIGGVLLLGMAVPSNSSRLLEANTKKTGAGASPFVVAIVNAGISGLPDVVNASLLVFVLSAANSDIYIASRTMYGMALDGYLPRMLQRTFYHIPLYTIGIASAFFLLAYMNVSQGSTVVFKYLVSVSTVLGLINWINILVAHHYFTRAMKAQGISRDILPFSGYWMPQRTVITLFFVCTIVFFNGFAAFIPTFTYKTFITSYIGVVVYIILILGWKFGKGTHAVDPLQVDLVTGRITKDDRIQEEEASKAADRVEGKGLANKLRALVPLRFRK